MKINEKYLVKDNSIIKDVLNNLKDSAIGISIVVNKKKSVVGVITDGDVRKKLLQGYTLQDKCTVCINKNFLFLKSGYKREEALKLFDSKIKRVPVLDNKKQLIEIIKSPKELELITRSVRAQSPARISLSGGGTDFSKYFLKWLWRAIYLVTLS